jgi:hypothetical protein
MKQKQLELMHTERTEESKKESKKGEKKDTELHWDRVLLENQ